MSGIHFAAPSTTEKLVFADGLRVVTDGPVSYILTAEARQRLLQAGTLGTRVTIHLAGGT